LPSGVASQAPANSVVQQYSVEALDSIWLPAAYEPDHIDGVKNVSYNADSGSLISDADTSNGLQYKVQSAVPHLSAAQLEKAPATLPADLKTRYTALPAIPQRVRAAALQAIGTARTPYAMALNIEKFFRKGDFVYDLNVREGHSESAIETFLRTKRGYCEQFAGTYAVLARAMGLPTRVAVGFTPGELGPDGQYHVRGLNAHAWPEVYIDGYGWVAFEPTPGRGIPGDGHDPRPAHDGAGDRWQQPAGDRARPGRPGEDEARGKAPPRHAGRRLRRPRCRGRRPPRLARRRAPGETGPPQPPPRGRPVPVRPGDGGLGRCPVDPGPGRRAPAAVGDPPRVRPPHRAAPAHDAGGRRDRHQLQHRRARAGGRQPRRHCRHRDRRPRPGQALTRAAGVVDPRPTPHLARARARRRRPAAGLARYRTTRRA